MLFVWINQVRWKHMGQSLSDSTTAEHFLWWSVVPLLLQEKPQIRNQGKSQKHLGENWN